MKIALVVKTFLPEGGGSERYVWGLAGGLVAAGHDVHVYAAEWPVGVDGRIGLHRVQRWSRPSYLAVRSFCRHAERIIRAEGDQYDVVVGFGKTVAQDVYRAGGGCHRAWLRQKWGDRWEGRARVHPLHRQILGIEDRIFGDPDGAHIICNSKLIQRELEAYYPAVEGRTTVVYNGVDGQMFNPGRKAEARRRVRTELGIGEAERLLLFVGHDMQRKGLDLALAAWDRTTPAARSRMRLLVVGKASQALSKQMDGVCCMGASSDMPALYAASDLLLFPTRYDAFSNVVLEAMASGIPVVTTDANGAAEVVEEGQNGWVVPLSQVVPRLVDLLNSLPAIDLDQMGQSARATAEGYTVERTVAESVQVYQRCKRRARISS